MHFFGFLALFMEVARRAIHIIGFYNFNLIQNIICIEFTKLFVNKDSVHFPSLSSLDYY